MTNPDPPLPLRRWSFWIDVGGTFTDCVAESPEGQFFDSKVLSSAITKGRIGNFVSPKQFCASSGRVECDRFWNGTTIRFIDAVGQLVGSTVVSSYSGARFDLQSPLDESQMERIVGFELVPPFHAPVLAAHVIMDLPIDQPLPPCNLHLGTTRGTNALLTRNGAKTALVTTRGFKDFLRIGDQSRPDLFELDIRKPSPIFESSIEIDERVLADGTVEQKPISDQVESQLRKLYGEGIESIAICLMHSYQYPEHEALVAQIARDIGFKSVRTSHQVAPLIKIIPRGETCALDAYLNPVIDRYLDEIKECLTADSTLRLMTSAGGLVSRRRFSGKDCVLSGPAGGVVGAARIAEQLNESHVIGFDMGGTSTDVSRYDGKFEFEYESRKAGVRIVTPMMAVETVAAGGGSICWFDGTRMMVGPQSAGADPGPVCYGRGGPLTVTDINLFLGRVAADHFPFPISIQAVNDRLDEMSREIIAAGFELSQEQIAQGFLDIANNHMASAIRSISIAKGCDPVNYLMVSFGGAGSQHCCAVAERLGIRRILDHPQSSMLSAVGIRLADQSAHAVRSVLNELDSVSDAELASWFKELEADVTRKLLDDENSADSVQLQRLIDVRYSGTDPFLTLSYQPNNLHQEFEQLHRQLYGYTQSKPIEIVSIRAEGTTVGNRLDQLDSNAVCQSTPVAPHERRPAQWNNEPVDVGFYLHADLNSGDLILGPAMIVDQFKTTLVDRGWRASVLNNGSMLIERMKDEQRENADGESADYDTADPIQLEIFNNYFSSIAREMGLALQRTSTSVNVKERLDFSCAIFTAHGDLVVNAPHIPVHLGAMSETVRAIIRMNSAIVPGDVFVTNDPYDGGSHLPDVTVVSPVFDPGTDDLIFWVASRSHHAEIGGIAPASMPAHASRLSEEGVLIQNFKLIDAQSENFNELRKILTAPPYPSRSPDENLADIAAQVAANRRGETDLLELCNRQSLPRVRAYMGFMQQAAEAKVRKALSEMPDSSVDFTDSMDNGSAIQVRVEKKGDQLTIDFSGTDAVQGGNLNANRAIVSAATMYVMRCLIQEDIPLNEGVMNPVDLVLPECFLNPSPAANRGDSPPVVGGNVEVSQRVVDVLLGALELAAASQGTMNNVLIGDDSFGYYETICGGAGATPDANGVDAVHTHMTNTRLTDPEILETRFPMILRTFEIRSSSGGRGQCTGGNGIIREIEFNAPLTVSLLTSRRTTQPFGLGGGEPGAPGQNLLVVNGHESVLLSQCELQVNSGDRLRLLTPGGGGFGPPDTIE